MRPSGPFATPDGALDAVGVPYSVKVPFTVTDATREAPVSASQTLLSAPRAMLVGAEPADGTGYSVGAARAVLILATLLAPFSVNQRLPSEPPVMPHGVAPAMAAESFRLLSELLVCAFPILFDPDSVKYTLAVSKAGTTTPTGAVPALTSAVTEPELILIAPSWLSAF